jgi:hypothetical protein
MDVHKRLLTYIFSVTCRARPRLHLFSGCSLLNASRVREFRRRELRPRECSSVVDSKPVATKGDNNVSGYPDAESDRITHASVI